jgi:hypothetical protein
VGVRTPRDTISFSYIYIYIHVHYTFSPKTNLGFTSRVWNVTSVKIAKSGNLEVSPISHLDLSKRRSSVIDTYQPPLLEIATHTYDIVTMARLSNLDSCSAILGRVPKGGQLWRERERDRA